MSFSDFGLVAGILRCLNEQQFTQPTEIQAQAIPVIMDGKDIMGAAQTGTGKTAAFTLPMLHQLRAGGRPGKRQARALVLTPTRELAAQVHGNVKMFSNNMPLRSTVVFGGAKITPQIRKLHEGVDVLVATPGRLLDLHRQHAVHFDGLEMLVLDEADRMLDMGFIHDIRKIMSLLPKQRQTLMFSATFSKGIRDLAKGLLRNPQEINVAPETPAADTVSHKVHPVDKARKRDLLQHLIVERNWHQALVFSRTKHGADKLVKALNKARIPSEAIHGNRSQSQRTRALSRFKRGDVQILVATDIAARGIDIEKLPQVVNFDLPSVPEDYVHRIGRTGRAGAKGRALSLVSADEAKQLYDIEKVLKRTIEREEVPGFEPEHRIPDRAPKERKGSGRRRGGPGKRRPQGGKSQGGKSQGGKSQGDKSRGGKPQGGKSSRSHQHSKGKADGGKRAGGNQNRKRGKSANRG